MAFDYATQPALAALGHSTLQFLHQNIATSAASTAMKIADIATATHFCVPYDGRIVAVTGCASANITASTIRVIPSINGATVTAMAATNTATTVRIVRKTTVIPSPYETITYGFSAGDRIGCKLSTTATYAPNTLDWVALVYVSYTP